MQRYLGVKLQLEMFKLTRSPRVITCVKRSTILSSFRLMFEILSFFIFRPFSRMVSSKFLMKFEFDPDYKLLIEKFSISSISSDNTSVVF
jgi:hypothetical protein